MGTWINGNKKVFQDCDGTYVLAITRWDRWVVFAYDLTGTLWRNWLYPSEARQP